MDDYGLDIKGTTLLERVGLPAWVAADEGRILYDTGNDILYFGNASDFQQIWSEANMGAGSGLDADTLDGYQASEILSMITDSTSNVPVGTILPFASSSPPTGYLVCDGSDLAAALYPELYAAIGVNFGSSGAGQFNVPDLQGRFLRMVDGGSGNDPDAATRTAINPGGSTGNNVGSYQADEYESHTHTVYQPASAVVTEGGGTVPIYTSISTPQSGASGGNETRPKNVYVLYIIKFE